MPRLPNLTPKRVIAFLKRNGFILDHTTGSHYIFYHPTTKKRTIVAHHTKDIPKGTLREILKQAGLSERDLV